MHPPCRSDRLRNGLHDTLLRSSTSQTNTGASTLMCLPTGASCGPGPMIGTTYPSLCNGSGQCTSHSTFPTMRVTGPGPLGCLPRNPGNACPPIRHTSRSSSSPLPGDSSPVARLPSHLAQCYAICVTLAQVLLAHLFLCYPHLQGGYPHEITSPNTCRRPDHLLPNAGVWLRQCDRKH